MRSLIIFLFIVTFSLKTFANNPENKCELITYDLIYFHFIKCQLTKKENVNGKLKELFFNNNSSFIFFDYEKQKDDYYIIGLMKNIKLNIYNYLEFEYENVNIKYKTFAKLKKNIDPIAKVKEIVKNFKDYYSEKINNKNISERFQRLSERAFDRIAEKFKRGKEGIFIYDIILLKQDVLRHCIDIKIFKPDCLKILI
jgi:hypothetical protein